MALALQDCFNSEFGAGYRGLVPAADNPVNATKFLSQNGWIVTRPVLLADRNYYVSTTGNDSNDGLTPSTPFLTIQHAISVVFTLDLSIFNVFINIANGTYTTGCTVSGPWVGQGTVTLVGDTTTPSNVTISTTSADCIFVIKGGSLSVKGLKLSTTTVGNCLNAQSFGTIGLSGLMEFGTCATAHMTVQVGGQINTNGSNYLITGGAGFHFLAQTSGQITDVVNTITLTGTPAFSTAFAFASTLSCILVSGQTYTGAATGQKYNVGLNAVINTFSGNINYFPGSIAGATSTGGQYA